MDNSYFKHRINSTIITKYLISFFLVSNTTFFINYFPIFANEEEYIEFTFEDDFENNQSNESLDLNENNLVEEVIVPKSEISLPLNHVYKSTYDLKEIPKYSANQIEESFTKNKNNPFLIESESKESNNSYFLSNLKVTGIIKIENKTLTIVSSIYGTDTFETGDIIGDGYLIKSINANPASVLISNNKYSRLFVLEEK